jgi:hypothetical protein
MEIRWIALFAGCCLTIPLAKTALKIGAFAHSGEMLIFTSKLRFFAALITFFKKLSY